MLINLFTANGCCSISAMIIKWIIYVFSYFPKSHVLKLQTRIPGKSQKKREDHKI